MVLNMLDSREENLKQKYGEPIKVINQFGTFLLFPHSYYDAEYNINFRENNYYSLAEIDTYLGIRQDVKYDEIFLINIISGHQGMKERVNVRFNITFYILYQGIPEQLDENKIKFLVEKFNIEKLNVNFIKKIKVLHYLKKIKIINQKFNKGRIFKEEYDELMETIKIDEVHYMLHDNIAIDTYNAILNHDKKDPYDRKLITNIEYIERGLDYIDARI